MSGAPAREGAVIFDAEGTKQIGMPILHSFCLIPVDIRLRRHCDERDPIALAQSEHCHGLRRAGLPQERDAFASLGQENDAASGSHKATFCDGQVLQRLGGLHWRSAVRQGSSVKFSILA